MMTNRRRSLATSASLALAIGLSLLPVACLTPETSPGKDVLPVETDPGGSAKPLKVSVYLDQSAPDTVAWDSAWSPVLDSLGNQTGFYRLPFMGSGLLLKGPSTTGLAKGTCGGWPINSHYLVAGPGQSLFRVNEPCEGIRRLDRWSLLPVDFEEIYHDVACGSTKTLAHYRRCLILQEGDRRLKISADILLDGAVYRRKLIGQAMSLQEIQDPPADSQITATGLRASFDLGEAPLVARGENAGTGLDTLREITFQGAHLRYRYTHIRAPVLDVVVEGGAEMDSLILAPGQALFRARTSCDEIGVWDPADLVAVTGYRIRIIESGRFETSGLNRDRECLLFRDGEIHIKLSPWVRFQENLPVQMLDMELMARPR